MTNKKALILKGFPDKILNMSWKNQNVYYSKLQLLVNNFKTTKCKSIFTFRDLGVSIDRLLEEGTFNIKDMLAVDYSLLFSEKFNNSISVKNSKLTYLYNIGREEVNNYSYSDKVLANIIKRIVDYNNYIIVDSDILNSTTFKRNYQLSSQLICEYFTITK